MSKICLIGGAGFIGTHLARKLMDDGHTVAIVDSLMVNNARGPEELSPLHRSILATRQDVLRRADFTMADARDYDVLSEIVGWFRPEVIVHLAAVAHQDRAQRSPRTTWGHSLRTLENALDIAAHVKAKRFVYFSSSTVYGAWPESGIVDEDTPCNPVHVYGSLKLAGELTTRSVCLAHGIEHQIVRPSALYGPGCISGRVIQRFIENALDGKPLAIRKDDRLDFTHVRDLVAGVALAMFSPLANRTYNLTFGEGRLVSEAASLVARQIPAKLTFANDLDQFPPRGTLSIERARKELGYSPEWPLERGIEDYVNFYRELAHDEARSGDGKVGVS